MPDEKKQKKLDEMEEERKGLRKGNQQDQKELDGIRTWEKEIERFHAGLASLDARLAAPEPLGFAAERLFQGPIADALTHVGQITLLRRMAGAPVRGENYFKAEISAGRVGPDQSPPRREFD